MSYESGQVTAAVTGSISAANTIPAGAAQVIRSGAADGVQTTDLHTVTAGKTLYITAVFVTSGVGAAAATGMGTIQADVLGDGTYRALVQTRCGGTATAVYYLASSNQFTPPVEVPAGKKVQIKVDAALIHAEGGFVGYEL